MSTKYNDFINSISDSNKTEIRTDIDKYLELKGIEKYYAILETCKELYKDKITWRRVSDLYRYDKRITYILIRYYIMFEEYMRAYLANKNINIEVNKDNIEVVLKDEFKVEKKDFTNRIKKIITDYKTLTGYEFFDLLTLSECYTLISKAGYEDKKKHFNTLDENLFMHYIIPLRNYCMHSRQIINKQIKYKGGLSNYLDCIINFVKVIPDDYKNGLINEINKAQKDLELPSGVIIKLDNQDNKKNDIFEHWLNKDSLWIKRALTDSSYKNFYTYKNHKEFTDYDNSELATLGDSIIKFGFSVLLLDKANNITEEKKKYESDYALVNKIARKYDMLKYLKFDENDKHLPRDYDYDNKIENSKNPHKYIATAVEAIIGAIYEETHNIKQIIELLKTWISFIDPNRKFK